MKYLPLFFLALFFACKNEPKQPAGTTLPANEEALPDGFAEFYQRFHLDSAFQVQHIVFPLAGLPDQADSTDLAADDFYWQAEGWQLMRPVDFQMSEFKREMVPLTPALVLERIYQPQTGIGMVRRFSIIGGDWHLIYYAGMNRLAR